MSIVFNTQHWHNRLLDDDFTHHRDITVVQNCRHCMVYMPDLNKSQKERIYAAEGRNEKQIFYR